MDKERKEILIMDYLNGTLNEEDKKLWYELVETGELSQDEIREFEALFSELDKFPEVQPGEKMTRDFYEMLATKRKASKATVLDRILEWMDGLGLKRKAAQLAYSMILVLAGLGVGLLLTDGESRNKDLTRLADEVQSMREIMMLAMIEQESVSDRLKAVNLSKEIASADREVIDALVKTLNQDENVNVRLEALDAMVIYAGRPEVREALIRSISLQESPLVQVALAEVMQALQEKKSVKELRKLLDRDETPPEVKEKIRETLNALS